MIRVKILITTSLLALSFPVWAIAPVVQAHLADDNYYDQPVDVSEPAITYGDQPVIQQQVMRAEEPMNPQMALVNQLESMKEQMRQMQGQIETQAHQLDELQTKNRELTQNAASVKTVAADDDADRPELPAVNNGSMTKPIITLKEDEKPKPVADKISKEDAKDDKAQDNKDYEQAYKLMLNKKYTQAQASMKMYLNSYPNGVNAGMAHYWLGELSLIAGDNKLALQEFETIVKQYPKSSKAADAMLKMGLIYYDQQNWRQAKAHLNHVMKQYPNTKSAQLAQQRLDKIKKIN